MSQRAPRLIKYHGRLYRQALLQHNLVEDMEVDKWIAQNGQQLGLQMAKALLQALKRDDHLAEMPLDTQRDIALWFKTLLFTPQSGKNAVTLPPALRYVNANMHPSYQLLDLIENALGESMSREMDREEKKGK